MDLRTERSSFRLYRLGGTEEAQSANLAGSFDGVIRLKEINLIGGMMMYGYDGFYEEPAIEEVEHEYLTPKEVMNLLWIGRNTFYKLVNSGELPAFRIGKLWRVRREELYSYAGNRQK